MAALLDRKENDNPTDRRRHPRAKCNFEVDIVSSAGWEMDGPVKAKAVNMSKEGLCIRISHKIPVGAQLSLVIFHAGHDSMCLGEVVWKEETTMGNIYGLVLKHWSYMDPTLKFLLESYTVEKKIVKKLENLECSGSGFFDTLLSSLHLSYI